MGILNILKFLLLTSISFILFTTSASALESSDTPWEEYKLSTVKFKDSYDSILNSYSYNANGYTIELLEAVKGTQTYIFLKTFDSKENLIWEKLWIANRFSFPKTYGGKVLHFQTGTRLYLIIDSTFYGFEVASGKELFSVPDAGTGIPKYHKDKLYIMSNGYSCYDLKGNYLYEKKYNNFRMPLDLFVLKDRIYLEYIFDSSNNDGWAVFTIDGKELFCDAPITSYNFEIKSEHDFNFGPVLYKSNGLENSNQTNLISASDLPLGKSFTVSTDNLFKPTSISIKNGHFQSESKYLNSGRLKRLRVETPDGNASWEFDVEDTFNDYINIDIIDAPFVKSLKFTIIECYSGDSNPDFYLSELKICGFESVVKPGY